MCGNFGSFTNTPGDPEVAPMRKILVLANETRGKDGLGLLTTKGRVRIAKPASDVLAGRQIHGCMFTQPVFLGHTRNASFGLGFKSASKERTHPFRVGSIVGAHNGYWSNWQSLVNDEKETHPGVGKFDVDSQIAIHLLDTYGTSALSRLRGNGTMWWMNIKDPLRVHLWIWRKELAVAEAPHLAFSSEHRHLTMAGFKKLTNLDQECGQLIEINLDTMEFFKTNEIRGAKDLPARTYIDFDSISYGQTSKRTHGQLGGTREWLAKPKPTFHDHTRYRVLHYTATGKAKISRSMYLHEGVYSFYSLVAKKIIVWDPNEAPLCDSDENILSDNHDDVIFLRAMQKQHLKDRATGKTKLGFVTEKLFDHLAKENVMPRVEDDTPDATMESYIEAFIRDIDNPGILKLLAEDVESIFGCLACRTVFVDDRVRPLMCPVCTKLEADLICLNPSKTDSEQAASSLWEMEGYLI